MKSIPSKLHGVVLIEQDVHEDERGWSCQPFSLLHHSWWQNWGWPVHTYVAHSKSGVFRGMHWQNPKPQAKFVQCISGTVNSFVVDIREGSPTFKQFECFTLNHTNSLYIPHGFAFGYLVIYDAILTYLIHGERDAECERRFRIKKWASPEFTPTMGELDRKAILLDEVPREWLFDYNKMETR